LTTTDESAGLDEFPAGIDLVRLAKTEQRDPVADLLRANVRRTLVGVDEPPRVGRFTTIDTIGRGAMGTVLAAWDPVLNRKVALKVVHPAAGDDDALLREARALARLTHPNVVTVYEADSIDGRVVIAMQFVAGTDLRKWLRARTREWDEVVPVFAAIARGLAAAHDAGVVHGDLKPENVLVGEQGDVRIADFGTARVLADASDEAGGGTPVYLAPERLAGGPANAKADQWAFCVSLFEALFGARPFAGTTIAELRESSRAGVEVPRDRAVPRWIVAVVQRGLARAPEDRWPSMHALAAELARDDRRDRWLAGLAAVASIFAAAWFAASREEDPCAGDPAPADAMWSDDASSRVRAAFVATGASGAQPIAERVDALLAARRDAWMAARREVCEATRVRAVQSDTLHDLRMRCLDRRAGEAGAVVEVLEHADATVVSDAITAITDLPELDRCDAARVQDVEYAVPDSADTRDEVAAARVDLDRARAAQALGRYDDALAIASAVVARADALAFAPLQAEALAMLGAAEARVSAPGVAAPTLRRARMLAAETGNDRLAAEVMVRWLRTVMFADDLAHVDELAEHARAAALRAGVGTAEIEAIVGEARLQAGDVDGAIAALEQALASETRADRRAIVQVALGSSRLAKGDADAALQLYEGALATATGHFGADHPALGFHLHRVGRGQREVGRHDDALATLQQVLALREATLGPDDRAIASILADLAATERALGRLDDAAAHQERAIAIRTTEYGASHPRIADLLAGLADIERARGHQDAALAHLHHALRIRESTPEHPQVTELRATIAEIETDQRAQ
jgi:tetratricopeptide (TPR) repeat protein/predicted Ser/Thr protein kinase